MLLVPPFELFTNPVAFTRHTSKTKRKLYTSHGPLHTLNIEGEMRPRGEAFGTLRNGSL